MKRPFYLLLLLTGCGILKQSPKEADYREIAPQYCNCIESYVGSIHPILVDAIEMALNDNNFDIEDHMDTIMLVTSEAEMKAYEKSYNHIDSLFDEVDVFKECYNRALEQNSRVENIPREQFESELLEHLNSEECKMPKLLLMVGNS